MNRTLKLATTALFGMSLSLSAHQSEEQKLTASDAAPGDLFGSAVVVEDAFMAVGAPGASGGLGAVYIFEHDGVDWVESAKLTPPDGFAGDGFGSSLGNHAHNELIVGAPGHDAAGLDAGAAYFFTETLGVWSLTQKMLAPSPAAGDGFGHAVAMAHGKIAIGAPREASAGLGSVYVYDDATGPFLLEQELTAFDATGANEYGFAIAFNGDTSILIGAPHQDGSATDDGAAYLYSSDGVTWSLDQKLMGFATMTGDHFGFSVDKFDAAINIGALGDDENGANAGAMYTFTNEGGSWNQTLKKAGLVTGNQLGAAAATHGRFFIGAQPKFNGIGVDSGQVRLWAGSLLVNVLAASDEAAGDEFGSAVSMDTCWIASGAPGQDAVGIDAGAVYVFLVLHPSLTTLNGSGVNPLVMNTTFGPNISSDWALDVDTTGHPTSVLSLLFVYQETLPVAFPTALGELLIDISSPVIVSSLVIGAPGVHKHEIFIPNDPYLMAVRGGIQGVLASQAGLLTMTNAEEFLIGCEGGLPHGHP